jgi:hypothetical protein
MFLTKHLQIYPAIKFLKEHCAEILTFLDCEGPLDEHHEDLVADLRNVNWEMATELEMFLEPFHETAQIFTDSRQPHFQRVRNNQRKKRWTGKLLIFYSF